MKILSIGNSFSQNAHTYIHEISMASGHELHNVNLYIGGCSLERHYNNMLSDAPEYELQIHGSPCVRMIGLSEALTMEDWDIVTLQQASHFSGQPQTYIPYICALADYVHEKAPNAKLYFHETWAYETDAPHGAFPTYDRNQKEMYRRLHDCAVMAGKLIDAPVIPAGTLIQNLRETLPKFDYSAGGKSLCADGFHLTHDYGCYAVSALWFFIFTGKKINIGEFLKITPTAFDKELIEAVTEKVYTV